MPANMALHPRQRPMRAWMRAAFGFGFGVGLLGFGGLGLGFQEGYGQLGGLVSWEELCM